MVASTFNPSTREVEAVRSLGIQDQSGLHSKFQHSQSYVIARPCLKFRKENGIHSVATQNDLKDKVAEGEKSHSHSDGRHLLHETEEIVFLGIVHASPEPLSEVLAKVTDQVAANLMNSLPQKPKITL